MPLTKAKLERFTAFRKLDIDFSPGLNVIVGVGGAGKTHLLQACYAAASVANPGNAKPTRFAEKLRQVFLPHEPSHMNSLKRAGYDDAVVAVTMDDGRTMRARFPRSGTPYDDHDDGSVFRSADETAAPVVYIETIEVLNRGASRTFFGEAHTDLMRHVMRKPLPAPVGKAVAEPLSILGRQLPGPVAARDGSVVVLMSPGGEYCSLSLLGEGARRLSLVWLLIRNGAIASGSTLFWDEPATGLNPLALVDVAGALLSLTRSGVQVILTTHDYVLHEELDMQLRPDDRARFHSLYNNGGDGTIVNSAAQFVTPNPLVEAFECLYDRAVASSLGKPLPGVQSSC